jgi:hypothetical protein
MLEKAEENPGSQSPSTVPNSILQPQDESYEFPSPDEDEKSTFKRIGRTQGYLISALVVLTQLVQVSSSTPLSLDTAFMLYANEQIDDSVRRWGHRSPDDCRGPWGRSKRRLLDRCCISVGYSKTTAYKIQCIEL